MSFELYKKSKELADNAEWTLAAWIRKAMEEKVDREYGSNTPSADAEPITRAEIRNMIREELGTKPSFTIKKQIQRL